MEKISPPKIAKMMSLYFQGHSETWIANKLKIDQSTVSKHKTQFKALAEKQGMKDAAEEYGVTDTVAALHSLSVELNKSQLTVEEAKTGLKMELLLQKNSVKAEQYADLIKACKRMKDEGFITAAIKLSQLEDSTSMSHEEIILKASSTALELKNNQESLEAVKGNLSASKEELANINKQKESAAQDLDKQIQKVAVDKHRLELVEDLALALKEAGISNEELSEYIKRQQILNKSGISLGTLALLLDKAKAVISGDDGQQLLKMLVEYGGLSDAIKARQLEVQAFTQQAAGLEQQAKLKGQLEGEIAKLKVEKGSLEGYVATLHSQKEELGQVKNELNFLGEKKAELDHEIAELEKHKSTLDDDIKSIEEKVSDLAKLESKRATLLKDLVEIETKHEHEKKRWEIFGSFLGFVQSQSLQELEKSVKLIPALVEEAKKGKYSPEELKSAIIKDLAGPTLQIMRCSACKARFNVDKPPPPGGYQCPIGGITHLGVVVDKDASATLQSAFAGPKQTETINMVSPSKKQPTPKEEKDSG